MGELVFYGVIAAAVVIAYLTAIIFARREGRKDAMLEQAQDDAHLTNTATRARDLQRSRDLKPDRLREDDGFRRD